jgi:hypothetical protein
VDIASRHFPAVRVCPLNVRYGRRFGREMLTASISLLDLGCVKTHTREQLLLE